MDIHRAYKILNLDENASFADAKKAYRCLAKQYHPDIAQARNLLCDDVKMKEINQAFVLLTPILRSKKAEAGPVKAGGEEHPCQTTPGRKSQNVPPKNESQANKNQAHKNRRNKTGGWRAFFSHMMDKLSAGSGTTGAYSRQEGSGRKKPSFKAQEGHHKTSFDQIFKTVHQSPSAQNKNRSEHDRTHRKIDPLKNYQTYMKFKKKISASKRRQNRNVCIDRVEKINPVRPVAAVKKDE